MIYVFDNSPLSALFKNFYPNRFPSLWKNFDMIIENGRLVSTREVLREIEDSSIESLRNWCDGPNRVIFTTPVADEGKFVSEIYSIPHFRQNIEQKKLYKGGKNADPFVIAKAKVVEGTVVTLEVERPNAVKIPNICGHFGVPCISLEEFMETEEHSSFAAFLVGITLTDSAAVGHRRPLSYQGRRVTYFPRARGDSAGGLWGWTLWRIDVRSSAESSNPSGRPRVAGVRKVRKSDGPMHAPPTAGKICGSDSGW